MSAGRKRFAHETITFGNRNRGNQNTGRVGMLAMPYETGVDLWWIDPEALPESALK